MQDVFKDKNKEREDGITDLINRLVDLLSLETRVVWDAQQDRIEPIKLWNKE